jgi:thioredoxin reductase (NADPH)
MFLSRAAGCVRLLVRGASLAASMSRYLASRLEANPKISIEFGVEVTALHGTQHLEAVTVRTSRPGIFAVGDVRAGSVKRVASAVGEGSVVIFSVWQYVQHASV